MIEQPGFGRGTVGLCRLGALRLARPQLFDRVGPEQVVQVIAARRLFRDQMRAGQFGERVPRLVQGHRGQAGRGGAVISGPGGTPSRRNIRAACRSGARYDQENTARTLAGASPASSASSRCRASRSSAASRPAASAAGPTARAAAIASASGSRAQSAISSPAAWARRLPGGPSSRASSSRASSG